MHKSDIAQLQHFQNTCCLPYMENKLILRDNLMYIMGLRTKAVPYNGAFDLILYENCNVSIVYKEEDDYWHECIAVNGICENFLIISFRGICEKYGKEIQKEITNRLGERIINYIEQTEPNDCVRGLRAYDVVQLATVIENEIDEMLSLLTL